MRQQYEARHRLVVIELGKERGEDLGLAQGLVGPREVRPVAPVLAGPEEEHLDAGLPAFLSGAEHIALLEGLRIDALLGGDEAHRLDAVAVARRSLEIE